MLIKFNESKSHGDNVNASCEVQELPRTSIPEPVERPGPSSAPETPITESPSSNEMEDISKSYADLASYQRTWNENILELLNRSGQNGQYLSPVLDSIENVMREFRLNGSDTDLDDPESSGMGGTNMSRADAMLEGLTGGGVTSPSSVGLLMRQASCPVNSSPSSITQSQYDVMYPTFVSVKRSLMNLPFELLRQLQSLSPQVLWSVVTSSFNTRLNYRRFRRQTSQIECAFCKNNGEPDQFYMSHILKDSNNRVCCPILRAFHCPRCGATGDFAHTLRHCPVVIPSDDQSSNGSLRSMTRMPSVRRHSPPPSPQVTSSTSSPIGQWQQRRSLF